MKRVLFLVFLSMSRFFADEGLLVIHRITELQEENRNLRHENMILRNSYEQELFLRQGLEQENNLLNNDIEGLRQELEELINENEVVTEHFNFCRLQLRHLSGQALDDLAVDNAVEEQE